MPLYMTQISYTSEALQALLKHPHDRGAVFSEQVEKLGGRVIAFYHCIGQYDVVTIYEVPDEATALTLVLTVKGAGHLKEAETTELYSVEVAMEAMRKASRRPMKGPDRWRDVFSSLADVPPVRPSD